MKLVDLRDQARRRAPEELLKHLRSFELELKFSAGIWFFSPAASRASRPPQPCILPAPAPRRKGGGPPKR